MFVEQSLTIDAEDFIQKIVLGPSKLSFEYKTPITF